MRWLLTVPADLDLAELSRALGPYGVTVDVVSRIPLGGGEQVVQAEGPEELRAHLEQENHGILKASPSSDLELFGHGPSEGEEGPSRC